MATFLAHALYPHHAPQSHWSPSVISVKLEDLSNKQEKTLFLCHITCHLTSIHSLELVKTWRGVEGLRAKSKGVSTPFFALTSYLQPQIRKEAVLNRKFSLICCQAFLKLQRKKKKKQPPLLLSNSEDWRQRKKLELSMRNAEYT